MDLSTTETQDMLRDTLSRFLADTYSFDARQKMLASPEGRDPGIWKALSSELGLTCAPFAEELGGMGGGHIENMIMMEELGKVIAIEPWLQTVVAGGGALTAAGGQMAEALIPQIISGDCLIAFAYAEPQGRYNLADIGTSVKSDGAGHVLNGHKAVVYGAPWATHFLVTARTGGSRRERQGVELFVVEANSAGISRRDYPTVDGFRASEVYFENVKLPGQAVLAGGIDLIEQVADQCTMAICAEATGMARSMLAQTVEYTQQRKQFGQPIGKFQALQHRMADMLVEAEQIASMSLMGTLRLGADAQARKTAVSAAKSKVSRSLKFVGQSAVQTHGGIGITMELGIGHYFKRSTMIENQFGGADYHLERYEALTLAA
ncbi:acyl-CoA dehydrogenase family protein [Novosphingobium sp.]|uniref:acyl-CoA dehydrogenase family protein n=1 Tax=Novosphingobium sp. TaxID=1874826 RepID=UPI00286A8758|nr:acyl-CoA dehydrogenase family protein [Novosphingobium sp.]